MPYHGQMAHGCIDNANGARLPIGAVRGYHVVYRQGEINHCPGCGRTHWLVGRLSAECAFCATAVPFAGIILPAKPAPSFLRRINPERWESEH
jgi:hypothetical protein